MSEVSIKQNANEPHPLDAVVWNSLTGKHQQFAVGDKRALRFVDDIGRFAAVPNDSAESLQALRSLVEAQGSVALVTPEAFVAPPGITVLKQVDALQMIWQHSLAPRDEQDVLQHVKLTRDDVPDMLALTKITEPGPFGPRTIELGDYLGVRVEGKLAAMAGERMKLDGFTEISAVCVDPAFRGRGYAGGLMKLLISAIVARGETPFLHVFESNHGAIALYRALGFTVRRPMQINVIDAAAR
ncbi:GNAT family N-acetyltransferase [Paraburkholderia sp. DHOC27]|uniref:GNAT family N-acetyltransferase n=1 Tax=Paraburkholderia sp. DHOC27 TaxID=2303330 RepID=UPI000E3D5D0A|nr:GNAT family N-acetyltransferase [Paraburkholderia sp. DHOC27]RFU49425.1 GNAT family N-acetyltransferase [Paraburkholderia sp. DHOC27]